MKEDFASVKCRDDLICTFKKFHDKDQIISLVNLNSLNQLIGIRPTCEWLVLNTLQ